MQSLDWIPWVTSISGVLLIIYVIVICSIDQVVITSKCSGGTGPVNADQVYFLPAAALQITATAVISVRRDPADNSLIAADLVQFSITGNVVLQPDTRQLLKLEYKGYWLTADDIRLTTDSSGLLASVAVTAEDRANNFISLLTDVPKKLLFPLGAAIAAPGTVWSVSNISASKTFMLYADQIEAQKNIDWKISIEGQSGSVSSIFDASFQLRFDKHKMRADGQSVLDGKESFDGVLTRPLTTLRMTAHLQDKNKTTAEKLEFKTDPDLINEFIVPDLGKVVQIHIKRSPFIKKVQTPKFSSGLLTENYINKPAELENFIKIPINIGKAIFSIPAQMLNFKIAHTQQESTPSTERGKLKSTVKKSANKAAIDAQKNNIDTAKELLSAQQTWEGAKKDIEDTLQKIQAEKT